MRTKQRKVMKDKIAIWLVGNTGLRSPIRIQEGLRIFAQSTFMGNLRGVDNEIGFMNLLNEKGLIHNEDGKDISGSHARKWRLMFSRNGFIYPQIKAIKNFSQKDLGRLDELTPFGRAFLQADTFSAIQECYLRALSVKQFDLPNTEGYFSPLRWILKIMLELQSRTGTSELQRIEFALWGQTTNPEYEIGYVVDQILELRRRRELAINKRNFDKNEIIKRGENYDKKDSNFLDYCDMNMRYLRISGILQRKGRGLIIVPTKQLVAEQLSQDSNIVIDINDEIIKLCNGAPLPTDNVETAKILLQDLMNQMKARNIYFDSSIHSLTTAPEINNARQKLEDLIAKSIEVDYANEQKNKWKEISDYMSLLIKGGGKIEYDEDNAIEVPKEETPAYLEWTLWRSALAINHLVNKPYDVRGFKLDSDFMPVSVASGGKGDLYCEFPNFAILTEVTMSSSSRQEAMEGEPVRRHVSDAVLQYNKPVYGMFIAVKVDTNTAETFRRGVWYTKGDVQQRLNIVPFTLKQFQTYFELMFKTQQVYPEKLVELIDDCTKKRDLMEAPAWKKYIDEYVNAKNIENLNSSDLFVEETIGSYGKEHKHNSSFPYGIYFGTKIKDTINNRIGCVIGIQNDYILVAFENNLTPMIIPASVAFFEKGFYVLN